MEMRDVGGSYEVEGREYKKSGSRVGTVGGRDWVCGGLEKSKQREEKDS